METNPVEEIRQRLTEIAAGLPEAEVSSRTGQHSKFSVRGKTFAYYTVDHHGNGRIQLTGKGAPGMRDALVGSDSERFFIAPYMGPKGWWGLNLDAGEIDWQWVREALTESYCLVAAKRLAAAVAQGPKH